MVTAKVIKDQSGYVSFSASGHAVFEEKGRDIVCSAISVLTVNTANSIMTFSDTKIETFENDGFLSWKFTDGCGREATLLMDSMILGLRSIVEQYDKYLTLYVEEV